MSLFLSRLFRVCSYITCVVDDIRKEVLRLHSAFNKTLGRAQVSNVQSKQERGNN